MSQDAVLITGAAGFIGFALARRLLERGRAVVGLDSINDYYDPALKEARLAVLGKFDKFSFDKVDLAERATVERIFRDGMFGPVVHLAAQAGVRYSLQNPHAYLDANLAGFLNRSRGLPPSSNRSSRLCLFELGLWRQHAPAIFGTRQCRPSDQSLCRDQEGQRADGACVQPSLRIAGDRFAIFHCLRSVGAS